MNNVHPVDRTYRVSRTPVSIMISGVPPTSQLTIPQPVRFPLFTPTLTLRYLTQTIAARVDK